MILFQNRRTQSDATGTIGELIDPNGNRLCFTLEDPFHEPKIHGQTRIPAGRYRLYARPFGDSHFDARYREKFGDMYRGMVQLADVPGFSFIEIHIGNVAKDTDGCLLVGEQPVRANGEWFLPHSGKVFEAIYPELRDAAESGDGWIDVIDERKPVPVS